MAWRFFPGPGDFSQARVLRDAAHRPWPVPDRAWVMAQSWNDLLFAHWRVPAEAMRAHVPEPLELDLIDGSAWIAVTPFVVSGARPRGLAPPPLLHAFCECNVRTYVTYRGKPGIWFFSLDASSRPAVWGARRTFHLPYFHARMRAGDWYESDRDGARLRARYDPVGHVLEPRPGSLEHALTERYCLYVVEDGEVRRGEIHHPPWPLQTAEAEFAENTMAAPLGIELQGEPMLHYARRQDVLVWALADA
jgi:hypothetical protein